MEKEIKTKEELRSFFGEDLTLDLENRVAEKGLVKTREDIEKSNELLLTALSLEGSDESWMGQEIYKVIRTNDFRLEALEILEKIKPVI